MALRTDVTVDWSTSPRIITIAAPSTTITIQDLDDTLRNLESQLPTGLQFAHLLIAAGKNDLGAGTFTGITVTLNNAKLAFAARAGPSFVQCHVTTGNLIAVDAAGAALDPIQTTSFTQVVVQLAISVGLVSGGDFNMAQVAGDAAAATNLKNSAVCDATAAVNLKNSALSMPYVTVSGVGFSPTTTQFETGDITAGYVDHYKNRIVLWRTGTLAYSVASITAFSVVGGRGHFTVGAMPAAPASGDGFVIV